MNPSYSFSAYDRALNRFLADWTVDRVDCMVGCSLLGFPNETADQIDAAACQAVGLMVLFGVEC